MTGRPDFGLHSVPLSYVYLYYFISLKLYKTLKKKILYSRVNVIAKKRQLNQFNRNPSAYECYLIY